MIIQCNSCDKKFTVPDSAITAKGRLVQCSACGNQWTQHPLNKSLKKTAKKISKIVKLPKQKNKKTSNIEVYSEEYLQKKHGIKIIDPSSASIKSNRNKSKSQKIKKISTGFGFYNYLITFIVVIIFLFGALNLTKDIIIYNYPFLEIYINHFYETLNNINLIILDIVSDY
tara:strand:- start:21 stop:533 length:513 start_codon:yes stop_codon:yes gene_type:complete